MCFDLFEHFPSDSNNLWRSASNYLKILLAVNSIFIITQNLDFPKETEKTNSRDTAGVLAEFPGYFNTKLPHSPNQIPQTKAENPKRFRTCRSSTTATGHYQMESACCTAQSKGKNLLGRGKKPCLLESADRKVTSVFFSQDFHELLRGNTGQENPSNFWNFWETAKKHKLL